jgi:hypothetical protein
VKSNSAQALIGKRFRDRPIQPLSHLTEFSFYLTSQSLAGSAIYSIRIIEAARPADPVYNGPICIAQRD